MHGTQIAARKTYLFAFLDDHSRLLPGYRWGYAEDTVRLAAALRPALASRGVPKAIYVDRGSAFVDAWLLRACAKLGVRLVHSHTGGRNDHVVGLDDPTHAATTALSALLPPQNRPLFKVANACVLWTTTRPQGDPPSTAEPRSEHFR